MNPAQKPDLCTYGPPDERKRSWILRFCDPEKDDMWFTNEPDAMRAFDRASGHWTCTLYVTAEFVNPLEVNDANDESADQRVKCNHWPGQKRCEVCGMGIRDEGAA